MNSEETMIEFELHQPLKHRILLILIGCIGFLIILSVTFGFIFLFRSEQNEPQPWDKNGTTAKAGKMIPVTTKKPRVKNGTTAKPDILNPMP